MTEHVLSAVQDAIALNEEKESGIENRSGRGLEPYSPIVYWVGWIAILYFAIWFVSVYLGPAIFGTRPYYPFYYGRNIREKRHALENKIESLTSDVLDAIEKVNKD